MSTALIERTKQEIFPYFLKLTDQQSKIKQPDRKGLSAQGAARAYEVLGWSYHSGMSGRDRLAPGSLSRFPVLGRSDRRNQVPGHPELGAHTPPRSVDRKADSCPVSG